ncbi:hypothetical protein ACFY7H_14245 [Streptomyces sp. NPDC012794]|uniref:hypothetical protein n=1 Tax=Streptomyces sp. NPDC012794 TaxID=3364850 RepID=UPI0036BC9C51
MRNHDENESAGRTPLSTEDLAGQDTEGRDVPVYPGEAAGDLSGGADEGVPGRDDADETVSGRYDEGLAGRDDDVTAVPGAGGVTGGAGDQSTAREAVEPDAGDDQPLLSADETERYRTAWGEIQGRFVDDPKDAVTSADGLVAELMQNLAGTFAAHKQDLEGQWQRGDEVATEDLRMALQQYRSFFNRLLKT